MTPAELQDIDRRMAEACGWTQIANSGTWKKNGWQVRYIAPPYTTDPALTMPLMEAEPFGSKFTCLGDGDGWFVRLSLGIHSSTGPTILIAFCLAYLARHAARGARAK